MHQPNWRLLRYTSSCPASNPVAFKSMVASAAVLGRSLRQFLAPPSSCRLGIPLVVIVAVELRVRAGESIAVPFLDMGPVFRYGTGFVFPSSEA
jgi:hypothetical protein